MKKVAIDTNIYAAFKAGNADIVELFRHCDYIGIDITVIAELYAGFAMGDRERKNRSELEAFLNTPRVYILTHDLETAEFYALIVKQLREKGKPIPTNDIWIAASAMRHSLALISHDRHFEAIKGLLLTKEG
jgi:tRNA(fMet)-specific endonuclease VapC